MLTEAYDTLKKELNTLEMPKTLVEEHSSEKKETR